MDVSSPNKNFENFKKIDNFGSEFWMAREISNLFGYSEWRNFDSVISKAIQACINSGQDPVHHFVDVNKLIKIGTGTDKEAYRQIEDIKLSRYACYLIAQNGDPRKQEIAVAQTYFALQTRKQEIFENLEQNEQRLFIRHEVKEHNKKLFSTAKEAGVSDFATFNNAGYQGLYGMGIDTVKRKKGIGNDNILDRAGTTELAANLFRITQTYEKINKDKIKGEGIARYTHLRVGQRIRRTIQDIGGVLPENLPAEKHIKEIEKVQKKIFTAPKKKLDKK